MTGRASYVQKIIICLIIRLALLSLTSKPDFPSIIVIDEPFNGIYHKDLNLFINKIKTLMNNIQIIIMTSNMELVKGISDSLQGFYELEKGLDGFSRILWRNL